MSKRTALITCVQRYMGEPIRKRFEELGIDVKTGDHPMSSQDDCEALVKSAGPIDILVVNLAEPPMTGPVQNIRNEDWGLLFKTLVDCTAKIIVFGRIIELFQQSQLFRWVGYPRQITQPISLLEDQLLTQRLNASQHGKVIEQVRMVIQR